MVRVILSQDFGILAECLSAGLEENRQLLQRQWIFVPNNSLKQWLLVQLARNSPSGCIAGYKISTIDEMLYSNFRNIPTKLEMRCLIYQNLEKNRLELSDHLSSLFFSYGKYGIPTEEGWQRDLFHLLFSNTSFQLPIQILPEEKGFFTEETCHFFGFSALPPVISSYLKKVTSSYFYLFSPCTQFWEDIRTDREQVRLVRNDIDFSPRLLANLGKLGRVTLKMREILDGQQDHTDPVYGRVLSDTALHALQKEIVLFEKRDFEGKKEGSLQVFLTGASKLHEVQVMGEEILRLCKERNFVFSDVQIYAPDIEIYVPLIEFVFSSLSIPFRFPHISHKNQEVTRLLLLAKGMWSGENVIALFETTSFSKKFSLQEKEHSLLREIFQYGDTWEKGLKALLLHSVSLSPGPSVETTPFSLFDSLEKLFVILSSLQEDLACDKPLTLEKWAEKWEKIGEKYLESEEETLFTSHIRNLRRASVSGEFPFEMVEKELLQGNHRSFQGNYMHAISAQSLQEGVVIPARVSFLLGMDEENFPRRKQATSLDIVKKEPDIADTDRYLFLQILLNTKDVLTVSYGDISEEDGKVVGPSSVVQELLDDWGDSIVVETKRAIPNEKKELSHFTFGFKKENPTNELLITLSDLTFFARHPWKYYLQKQENIVLEERSERSFKAKRSTLARLSLLHPVDTVFSSRKEKYPGIFEKAFEVDVQEKARDFQKQIDKWGKKKRSIRFYETANENEFPPLQFQNCKIIGEIPYSLEDGALHFGDDHIGSLIKVWPEVLAACIALNTSKIYFVKSGKIKNITNAKESLQNFIDYYLRCSESLSPLIPDWADAILRGKNFSPEFDYEDEVHKWLMPRLKIANIEEWDWLKTSFAGLIGLYEKV